MIRVLKNSPQALLQTGCLIVAVWFLAADLLGEDTMPESLYGNATALAPAWAWAASIIASTAVYLIGFLHGWRVLAAWASAVHLASVAALAGFILYAPGFSPLGPWSAILTVTLAGCLSRNIDDLLSGDWYD